MAQLKTKNSKGVGSRGITLDLIIIIIIVIIIIIIIIIIITV